MSKELATIPINDIEIMGAAVARSKLFGIQTPEQAVALMLVAQAQGRHPATVAMEYDIIQGKPALKSQAALMRFQESGGKIKYIKRSAAEVTIEFTHPAGGTVTVSWDMKRAADMGFAGKDNWKKQPMIMLQWRCIAEGVRACFPACLGGSYLVEEVQDFEPPKAPRDITPDPTAPIITDKAAMLLTPDVVAQTVGGKVEKPPKSGKVISEPQRKRLFAIAHGMGWKNDELKKFLLDRYGVEHSDKIDKDDYEAICKAIEAGYPVDEGDTYQGELG